MSKIIINYKIKINQILKKIINNKMKMLISLFNHKLRQIPLMNLNKKILNKLNISLINTSNISHIKMIFNLYNNKSLAKKTYNKKNLL
jgi:hypothetical protein